MAGKINYTTAAAKSPGNIFYLALAGGLTLLTGSWIVGAVALTIEIVYLGAQSGRKGFRRKVRRKLGWQSGVTPKLLAEQVSRLNDERAGRYQLFRKDVNAVIANAEQRELDDDPLIGGVLANLQTLSASYLTLLAADRELANFAETMSAAHLQEDLAALDEKIAQGTDAQTIMALEQNRDLLAKRLQRAGTVAQRRTRIAAQLDLMDSTAKSLRNQLIEMTSPADITSQIDLVLTNMNDARLLTVELATSYADELPASIVAAQRSKQ